MKILDSAGQAHEFPDSFSQADITTALNSYRGGQDGGGQEESAGGQRPAAAATQKASPEPPAAPEPSGPSRSDYATEIREAADRHGVDPALVTSMVRAESSFNPRAVSKAGARGLMQLMPDTATSLGVRDSFDPRQNIDGGVRHLRSLLDRYQGDTRLALAAYNAGADAVDQHGGVPPYPETQQYVQRVLGSPVPRGQASSSRPGLFGSPAQRQAAIDRGRRPPTELETNVASGVEITKALLRMGYSHAEIDKMTPAQVSWHLDNQDKLNDYPRGIELEERPGPEMDMGRGIRAGRGAIALELVIGHGPAPASPDRTTADQQMRGRSGPAGILRTMPTLPDGPMPRRYVRAARSCLCHRCGRRLVGGPPNS